MFSHFFHKNCVNKFVISNGGHGRKAWKRCEHSGWLKQDWWLGHRVTFASETKFEIEAKISFRLKAKKSLISHDSLRCETPKIWSKNEGKISKKIKVKRKLSGKKRKKAKKAKKVKKVKKGKKIDLNFALLCFASKRKLLMWSEAKSLQQK